MRRSLFVSFSGAIVVVVILFGFMVSGSMHPVDLAAAAPAVDSAVFGILAARKAAITEAGDVSFGADDEINILALGIDSRKEGDYAHCDSIHMITLRLQDWSIKITSVPRGTTSPLPAGRTYESYEYYLANACWYGGLDYGIKQIENVVGVKADYVATVGFSEALGIFRTLDLPTTDTLEWLRNRRVYQVGDPQRSQNQAQFMKDTAVKLLDGQPLPTPFLYILYKFMDTDMDFKTVKALYDAYYASGLGERTEDVTLDMKPPYPVEVIHYDPATADKAVQDIIDFLKPVTSKDDLSGRTIDDVQNELIAYLRSTLADPSSIVHVYNQQLFRQVEDDATREELQFRFLDRYVQEIKATDPDKAVQEVTDYILEKEYFGAVTWEEKGKEYLDSLSKEIKQTNGG